MADAEEPQFSSLAERIAALNQQNGFKKRPPPPRRDSGRPVPPLPSRAPSSGPARPQLPPRTSNRSGSVTARRSSASSDHSSVSSLSLVRAPSSATSHASNGGAAGPRKLAPALCDPASLPPLPPTRREREAKTQHNVQEQALAAREFTVKQAATPSPAPPSRPSLPPRPPSRPARSPNAPAKTETETGRKAPRKLPPMVIKGFGSGQSTSENTARSQARPVSSVPDDAPPPVPVASRPSAAQIESVSARAASSTTQPLDVCLVCRDWSGPDGVAAQFPRETLPRRDPVGYLAHGLCEPFPSYTDKARAIFTWCHHNIMYDTVAFFGNNVRSMSVEDTIFSGKAVCQGYAETYKAIANRAGLDCIVVGGHGKGFGHVPLKRGEKPPPPKADGHAWNAVRIDGGDWKLIDACWGAGHISNQQYKKEFSPHQFVQTNEAFGLRHFPSNPGHQFRSDGRVVSWEEYFVGPTDGEPPVFFNNGHEEGIAEHSVEPRQRDIAVDSGGTVRFQFSKICEHWTSDRNGLGRPPLLLLSIHGVDGRQPEMVPMETNGFWHWLDVKARDLGAPGQAVEVAQLTTMDGRDARGVSAKEYLSSRGKVGMAWAYVLKWELV